VGVTVEAMTGFSAEIINPGLEMEVFTDRTYVFDSLGSFTGHSYVKMSNEDKHIRHSHVQMKLRFTQPTVVYIAKLDDHELPWLASEGWRRSSLAGVSYSGIRETRHTDWSQVINEDHYGPGEVYEKIFPAGAVELRGNNGGDGSYIVFVANPHNRPSPPDVELWIPVLGSEHGQRVKCNDNVDMVYVADQATCQQLAITNGHPFYSFRHNGENGGHKCMSSAHRDDHLTERTNEWHIYSEHAPGQLCGRTIEQCRAIAESLGMQVGGAGFNFVGDYSEEGCYSYHEGQFAGKAYYGTVNGGEVSDSHHLGPLPAHKYRLPGTTDVCGYDGFSHVHGGHCAGGGLGGNSHQADIDACAAHCRSNAECHYFAFCDGGACDGNTNCAMYTEAGGCPDDNNWGDYEAYVLH